MRRYSILIMILGCSMLGIGLGHFIRSRHVGGARAGLVANAQTQDLGRVPQGSLNNVRFALINRSPSPITIDAIHSTCDCTTTDVSEHQLAPGESTSLAVTWNTTNKRGATRTSVQVPYRPTNEAVTKPPLVLDLVISANIIPSFVIEPEMPRFSSDKGDTRTLTFVHQPHLRTFRILGATCPNKCIRLNVKGPNVLEVEFLPQYWSPELAFLNVVVQLDNESEPSLVMPVAVVAAP